MAALREWTRRVWGTLTGQRRDADLEEELRLHLEMTAEEARRQGHSPEEAMRRARIEAGGLAQAMDAVRDQRGLPWLDDMIGDLRIAWRMMRRSPIFSIVAVLSLALGIGANTAIFSLVNTLVLRPLPVHEPERLVEVLSTFPGEPRTNGYNWPVYEHYRDNSHVFADVFAMSPTRFRVGDVRDVSGEYVTDNFFSALGLTPAIGRMIGADDAQPGATPAIVISWQMWRDRFDLSPSVVGQSLDIDGAPATIVGVTPRSYQGLLLGFRPQVWRALPAERRRDNSPALAVMARLKPDVTIDQARAEMRVLDRFRIELLSKRSPNLRQLTIDLASARSGFALLRDRYAAPLLALSAIVGLLLLVACTNIAGVLLARSTARHREMAVRVSVGASRGRLIRQMLAESLLLSAAGGVLGLAVAHFGVQTLIRTLISGRTLAGLVGPMQLDTRLDTAALLFTTVVAIVTGVLFGLAPAWHAFTNPPVTSLRESGTAAETKSKRLFAKGLIVAQVSISLVLLTAAALFINHLSNLRSVGLGFDRKSVLIMTLDASRTGFAPEQLKRPYQELLARLAAMPNAVSATVSAVTPIHGAGASRFINMDGVAEPEERMRTLLNWVAPRYFETYGTPLIAGRDFSFTDEGQARVAILNQSAAKYYFGDGPTIGRRFTLEGYTVPFEIIGIVADAKYLTLREAAPRTLYLNVFQESRAFTNRFSIRTTTPPASMAAEVRRVAGEIFEPAAVASMTTLEDQLDAEIVPERLMALLSALFAALGAALAGLGLYGLLAYTVTRRTNEIGVRMALGATRHRVVGMVMRSALGMVIAGLIAGVPIAFAGRRAVASLVASLPAGTTLPVASAAGALLVVALVASFVPARRAASIDPSMALRHD